MRYLSFIFIFWTTTLFAVDSAPRLLRSCINFNDSVVTISWQAPTDACGSFTHYSLYENVNGGTFSRIAVIPNIAITEYPHKLPDLNTTRSYYITVHTLCDMLDSATSQTIAIDVTYPDPQELDSLSYDLATQNIIAGWSPNTSTDTKGYEIYDYSSGNGDSIGFTTGTNFTVTTDPLNVFPVVMAALDSCNLSTVLSTPHRAMRLTERLDTCDRRIRINWSRYQGWQAVDSQHIMMSVNHGPYTRFRTIGGATTSYEIGGITLGDTICLYIRAYAPGGTITSSSNIACVETRAFEVPSYIYLSQVTVVNDHDVHLEWEVDNATDMKVFYGHRSDNNSIYVSRFNVKVVDENIIQYTGFNPTVNVHEDHHVYKISVENVCGDSIMESNEATTIRLAFGDEYAKNHNHYRGFDGGVQKYELQKQLRSSFTWNTIRTQDTPFNNIDFSDSSGCYRVLATENMNTFGYFKTSLSNTECILAPLTYYMPNAINRTTENNRFIIYGEGIDHSRSFYMIYNRWGEMLANQKTNEPWYGDYNGEPVPNGMYMYVAHIYGVLGEKRMVKDYIYVFK